MGAGGRGVPRLRGVPAQDRPGDPGRARRAEELNAHGPVVVVTGASDGIGAAAARRLHRSGAQVVVVGRSPEKTAAVAAELDGARSATVDLARLDDVRRLAAELAELPRIDVLAHNAGASFARRELTEDGHERTAQVDHLGPYLLTRLLEDQLRASGARVVTTSSFMHWAGGARRGHLLDRVGPHLASRAYARAKWCNVLFTRELARRWAPEVSATCFDPGAVASSFGTTSGGITGLVFRTPLTAFMRTPAQGADTLVWLATADDGWRNGGHHADRSPAWTAPSARDDARARELWEVSARLVGLPA
ncbi:SDR family NAD(P)-dependent oxidoreductase [Modestobacter sp. VKM Ac-2985]|uniref:SDR family NAD(P)-dependent oxidoreductase n=1 Tax=Modestobacter sp. VKM Ac-2985 TaxID=3004139 RepID=UPI0022AB8340|nr:SDR family NAD(P)-dependent oxidoreductase [Modestobacter sp. VKM Ac-2985]MCZ2836824.1 SDR family NAD(P)-dependent oxidoreductase [Modestobacter sp. VKM Ac-2985]